MIKYVQLINPRLSFNKFAIQNISGYKWADIVMIPSEQILHFDWFTAACKYMQACKYMHACKLSILSMLSIGLAYYIIEFNTYD